MANDRPRRDLNLTPPPGLSRSESQQWLPTKPTEMAGLLVHDACLLTTFQAEQILQGKYRRFTIGKYKVLERLGVGGMGSVYLCEHKLMRRRVAVKVLPTAKANDDASRRAWRIPACSSLFLSSAA